MEKDVYKLTAPQNAIYLTEQYYQNTNINNICGSVTISEKVNFENLEQAINIFVKNTDSFRIKLFFENSEIKQYISEYTPFKIDIIQVNFDEDIIKLEKEIGKKVFNIIENELYEFKLFKLPNGNGGFIINAHHIISDSWTLGILVNKIIEIYSKLNKNEEIEDVEILSYVDYIKSEQEYLQSEKYKKDKEYWEEIYKTVPEIAEIPSMKDKKTADEVLAKRELINISKEELSKINEFCAKNKVSIYNFFMAVFGIYISKISNLNDFCIGTPILNRTNYKEKHTPGMFISTIPFRININSEEKFNTFASKIAIDSMGMLRHQKYSYQYIIENLRKQDSSLPNLYNIMLSYQITKMMDNMEEVPHSSRWAFNETISDDIDIHIFDFNGQDLNIAYDYKLSKYSKEDIIKMHNRIMHIVDEVIENNEINIKNIEIVTEEEKNQILNEFNNTKVEYPKDKTVVDLFEEQVEKNPDNIAVVFQDEKLTYKELNEKANSLAHYLVENGVKDNSVVGIMVNRSLEMIVGILAILKSDAAYLPIDPEYPKDRIEYMLEDSNCKNVLVNSKTINLISNDFNKVNIELTSEVYNNFTQNLNKKINEENLMYLIYTSGSTGKPKGVMLKHKNIFNFVNGMKSIINFENKVMVSVTTISFDIFVLEVWCSLLSGIKLVIANENEQVNAKLLNELCVKNSVTMIQTTPSRFLALMADEDNISFFNNLTDIMVGGEAVTLNLLKNLKSLTNANVFNMYGPTETAVWSTVKKLNDENEITIGKPIVNTTCYILDNDSNLLPVNAPGTLYIGGAGVSKGYLNRDELTKEKFIKSPFSENEIIYNTGDLAYFKENGEIVHLGRNDFQVKINGYRIELSEIENNILLNENISNCVVLPIEKENNSHVLCAFILADKKIDTKLVKNNLLNSLPKYMIPSQIIQLDEFPYTPNGKLDRKKLYTVNIDIEKNSSDLSMLNDDEVLKDIVNIINEKMNILNINLEEDLFNNGFDSLSIMIFSTYVNKKFNIDLSIKDFVDCISIVELSNLIKEKQKNQEVTIPKAKEQESYPVSSAQRRMYYASSIDGENSLLYNIAGGLILDSKIDKEKLEKALKTIINRHESLRTYFEIENGEIVQKIIPEVEFKLDVINTDKKDYGEIFKENVKPFNLSKAPLFEAKLISLKNGKEMVLLNMHHIISDGMSLGIITKELEVLYNEQEKLEEKELEYKDYAVWENNKLKENKYEEDKKYWVGNLKDEIPLLNMPTNFVRQAVKSFEGNSIYSELDENVTAKINVLAKKLNVTPYMLLLSVYYIMLYKYTGQKDIVVGTPVAGRNYIELTDVIGMFVNSLPLRNKIDSKESFKEFLNNIKENCLEAFEHQEYPFDELVKELGIKRDIGRSPIFDTMFIYQNNGMVGINLDGIKATTYTPKQDISKFDISLEIIPENNKLEMRFEYCTKLFKEEFVVSMSKHYINILNKVLENEEIEISKIEMITEEEKKEILNKFNNTKVEYSKDKTVIELFEEQVEKNPNNIAVVFQDDKITYKELNEKANSLAHYLIENGVKENSVVGIMLNRSTQTIISMFAVLKTNSAYMLIDKDLPEDRIKYMLSNANSCALITSETAPNIDFENKIYIDEIDLDRLNNENLKLNYSIGNNLSIVYTSGSTGLPKGVLLNQKGMINLLNGYKEFIDINNLNNFISICSVSFDMFAVEIYCALLNGKKLFLTSGNEYKDPTKISKIIDENNVEYIMITPSKIELLLANDDTKKCLSKLKSIQLGGEVLTSNLYNVLRKYTNAQICNQYGPSEITSCCSYKNVVDSENINIGKPINNSSIYILNPDLNLCPIGIPGEICVVGDGVSKGYINNEEATKKVFVKNPYGSGMLYKTGDIGKFNENGELEYIGRKDFQVKLRGLRIELSEIEKQILNIENIKNCAVIYKQDEENAYLVAFFTSTKEKENVSKIREELTKKLPLYMVPKYIIQLEEMPITRNGKINLKELKKYDVEISETSNYVAPETELQKLFCDTWEKLLKTKVGIENDIFELGADSLLAIKFKVEMLANSVDIAYADIFKYPTVKELSNANKITIAEDLESFDYTNINKVLEKNNVSNIKNIQHSDKNNILLLGANGFVGMHILSEFIKLDKGIVYCIVRDKNKISAKTRFLNALHFYFGESLDKYIDNRIIVLRGDITKDKFGLEKEMYNSILENISIVINSSANVRHYGNFKDFEDINIGLTKKAIDFCKINQKRLIHISTTSVCGRVEGNIHINFAENNLYIGQMLDNIYVKSKYEAERIILENIFEGLDAKILRIGNITNRYSDGEFQVNPSENAFMLRIQSLIKLGVIPDYLLNTKLQFTPVDILSKSIVLSIQNNAKDISVLHLFDNNYIEMREFVQILNNQKISLKPVSSSEFSKIIREVLVDNTRKDILSGIINDLSLNNKIEIEENLDVLSEISRLFLNRLDFKWEKIDNDYIEKYIKYMKKIKFI